MSLSSQIPIKHETKEVQCETENSTSKEGRTSNFANVDVGVLTDNSKALLEDALNECGLGRYSYNVFILSTYCLLAAAAEIFGLGLIITSSQCDLNLDVWKKGIIASVPMLGILMSSHLWGYIADTRGRRYTLIITLGGTCVGAILSSFAWHWSVLAFTKFLSAFFASGTNAVSFALIGESIPFSHRSQFLMYSSGGLLFSQGFVAMLAFPILSLSFDYPISIFGFSYRPWRLLAQVYGLSNGLGMMLLMFLVFESPKFLVSSGRIDDGLFVLTKIYALNTGKSPNDYKIKSLIIPEQATIEKQTFLRSVWTQTIPLLHKKHIKNTLLISYMCIVVYASGPAFVVWLPAILNAFVRSLSVPNQQNFCGMLEVTPTEMDTRNVTKLNNLEMCDDSVDNLALTGLACFGLLLCILTTSSVWVVALFGKRWTIVGMHVMCAGWSVALNYVYGIGSMAVFALIIVNATCMGITTAFAVELFPTNLRGMAVCLTIMVGRGMSSISIYLIGQQLESNCENFFYILAAFIFSGAVIGWFLPSDTKKNEQK